MKTPFIPDILIHRFRFSVPLILLSATLLFADSTKSNGQPPALHPWSETFTAPTKIVTERAFLEPLTPDHTAMDFAAVKSSSEHLRETLQWGSWPPADMTEQDNRAALENHWAEFENHEAYA